MPSTKQRSLKYALCCSIVLTSFQTVGASTSSEFTYNIGVPVYESYSNPKASHTVTVNKPVDVETNAGVVNVKIAGLPIDFDDVPSKAFSNALAMKPTPKHINMDWQVSGPLSFDGHFLLAFDVARHAIYYKYNSSSSDDSGGSSDSGYTHVSGVTLKNIQSAVRYIGCQGADGLIADVVKRGAKITSSDSVSVGPSPDYS